MNPTLFAFLISLLAGLSTAIGGLVPLFTDRRSTRFLCFSLGLSAGVMVYVSFMEMLPEAIASLGAYYSRRTAGLMVLAFFLIGMAVIALIDRLVPENDNPHEFGSERKGGDLGKMGLLSALAIAVHNFPEGLATFMSALEDPVSGVSIAIAIALHNIPEVPLFRQKTQGVPPGSRLRHSGACWCTPGLPLPVERVHPVHIRPGLRPCGGHHGLPCIRRAAADCGELRASSSCDLRRDSRHGPHGPHTGSSLDRILLRNVLLWRGHGPNSSRACMWALVP